ncbi:hypothetical protein [Micromonospora sp. NPDC049171]|uniref:hypothetical protein n=1 Tax=Micromonospora sp. NPDC049171 TaxID=3155770 RepID=UPI0033E52CD6
MDVQATTVSITAGATIVGVLLGHLLTRNTEYRKWLRVERYNHCVSLLRAGEELHMTALVDQIQVTDLDRISGDLDTLTTAQREAAKIFLLSEAYKKFDPSDVQHVDGDRLLEVAWPGLRSMLASHAFSEVSKRDQKRVQLVVQLARTQEEFALLSPVRATRTARRFVRAAINSAILSEPDKRADNHLEYDQTRKEFIALSSIMLMGGVLPRFRRWMSLRQLPGKNRYVASQGTVREARGAQNLVKRRQEAAIDVSSPGT